MSKRLVGVVGIASPLSLTSWKELCWTTPANAESINFRINP